MTKEEFINKIYEETKDYGRMQFVNKIAEKELKEEKVIKYIEDKIKENQFKMNNVRKGFHNYTIARTKRDSYQDILERLKSGKYE